MSYCWTIAQPMTYISYSGDTLSYPYIYNYSYYAHSGTKTLYSYFYSGYGYISNSTLFATPYISHNPSDLHVSFWMTGTTMDTTCAIEAGVMTDPEDDSTFIPLLSIPGDRINYNYYTQFEFYTAALADILDESDSVCVAFRYFVSETQGYATIYLDDLTIDAMGDCLPPVLNSGIVDSIGYESVLLGWQEAAEGGDVGAGLDVVVVSQVDAFRKGLASGPPCAAKAEAVLDEGAKPFDRRGVGVPAHQGDAADLAPVAGGDAPQAVFVERFPCVFPQMRAVASGATDGTPGEIDGQRHLVGYLLEYDVVVVEPKHPGWPSRPPAPEPRIRACCRCSSSGGRLPSGAAARSCSPASCSR